jgi:5-oxoprolinase (ATP-hydrolysing) subunit A
MSLKVDINCDMGESLGAYRIGNDEEAVKYITSANVACGFHASDPTVMEKTVDLCKKYGVGAGAHPGYPDLVGFGRRFMDVPERDLVNYVVYQVGALNGFLAIHEISLQHVKLHGALYNYLAGKEELFVRIAGSVMKAFGEVVFLTLGSGKATDFKGRCRKEGIRVALEAFPDRQYTDEGELLSRTMEKSVLRDPVLIAERAVKMVKEKGVESVNGRWIAMDVDTICIHGDNEESIVAARLLRAMAEDEGMEIVPLGTLV